MHQRTMTLSRTIYAFLGASTDFQAEQSFSEQRGESPLVYAFRTMSVVVCAVKARRGTPAGRLPSRPTPHHFDFVFATSIACGLQIDRSLSFLLIPHLTRKTSKWGNDRTRRIPAAEPQQLGQL